MYSPPPLVWKRYLNRVCSSVLLQGRWSQPPTRTTVNQSGSGIIPQKQKDSSIGGEEDSGALPAGRVGAGRTVPRLREQELELGEDQPALPGCMGLPAWCVSSLPASLSFLHGAHGQLPARCSGSQRPSFPGFAGFERKPGL